MRLPWPVARPLQAYGLVLGTVSASVAFGGGCGGGGEPLSASEYRKQANALCAEQAGVVASVPRPEPDDFARWVETANDRLQPLARSYNNLKPPPQLRSLHDRAVAALRSDWADTDRLINEVSSSDEPRKILERERRREEPIFRELLDVYTALEVRDCVLLTAATADYGGGRSESRVTDAGACREIKATGRELRGDVRSAATEVRAERRTVEGLEGEVRTYPEDRAEIEPDLNSSQRTLKDDRRELTTARRELRSLEADARREGCALATEPAPVDAAACHEIAESSRELRKDVRGAAEEARAEQTTIDELERDIRSYPEERAETEPDLRDSQRALKDIQGELATAQRGLKSAQADARSERCSR